MFSVYTVPDGMRASARLQSLKPAFLTELATAFQLYVECQTLFFDTVLTSKATRRTQLQRLKPLPSMEAIPLMRQLTSAMATERRQLREDYQRKAYRDQLTPAFFQQRRAASPTLYERARVEELEIRWQVHGKFAHFGPKALLRTLHMALAIEERLQWAAEELIQKTNPNARFRRALPAALIHDYQQYLSQQLATIQAEKRSLLASCSERLRIAVLTQTLEKNEVVSYTYARLGEQLGSSAAEAHPPSGITAPVFQHMQDCIFLHGDPETQRRTRQLPWFKVVTPPEANPPRVILQPPAYSVTYAMAAQFGLADQLPTRVRRPQWLFKGTRIRAHFFSDNFDWASACLARGRAEWAYPQAIEPRQLTSLRHSLRSLDTHWTAVDTRLKNAQNALQHPIRRRVTQQTQQFLKRIESDYQRLRAHDTQQLGQYLDRLAHLLSSASPVTDVPYPSIDAFLTQLGTLSIGQTPVVHSRLVSLRQQVTDHRARQQQHAQTMARMNEATERLALLYQQTRGQPADAAAVTALLDFVDALPPNDPIRAHVQRDITTWVEQAQNAWDAVAAALQPEEEIGEGTDDTKRHSFSITGVAPAITRPPTDYHYLHNLGRLLPLIDNAPARDWLHTTAENLLCEYLRAWAAAPSLCPDDPSLECIASECISEPLPLQGRPDPHSATECTSLESTPVEHNKYKPSPSATTPCELISSAESIFSQLDAAVSLQAETLQCLGNPAVQQLVTACESLRREGQWDALRQLATTQLHTVEPRCRQRHRLRQLQQWEVRIDQAISASPALILSTAQRNHLHHLAHRLADENNGDVETWEGFTATDRAWLGLGGRWFDRWTTTRSPLVSALSTLARLYRVMHDLPQQSESQRTETMERLQHQCDRTLASLGVELRSLSSRTATLLPATRRDTPTATMVTPVTTAARATTSTASTTSTPVTHSPYSH